MTTERKDIPFDKRWSFYLMETRDQSLPPIARVTIRRKPHEHGKALFWAIMDLGDVGIIAENVYPPRGVSDWSVEDIAAVFVDGIVRAARRRVYAKDRRYQVAGRAVCLRKTTGPKVWEKP